MRNLTDLQINYVCGGGVIKDVVKWVASGAAYDALKAGVSKAGQIMASDGHNQKVSDFSNATGENYYGHSNNAK